MCEVDSQRQEVSEDTGKQLPTVEMFGKWSSIGKVTRDVWFFFFFCASSSVLQHVSNVLGSGSVGRVLLGRKRSTLDFFVVVFFLLQNLASLLVSAPDLILIRCVWQICNSAVTRPWPVCSVSGVM